MANCYESRTRNGGECYVFLFHVSKWFNRQQIDAMTLNLPFRIQLKLCAPPDDDDDDDRDDKDEQ